MSATTLAHQGLEAVQNKQYEAAIPLLDKALASSSSPAWLLARAQAHQQLKNHDAALRDVAEAYHVAAERGSGTSRKQMIQAQYRRAVIYYKLGRYADSDCCAKWSMLLAEGRPAREDDGVEKRVDGNGAYTVTYEDGVADRGGQPGQGEAGDFKQNMLAGMAGGAGTGAVTTPKTGFEDDWKRAYTWRSQALMALKNLPEDHAGKKVFVSKIPSRPQKEAAKEPEPEVEAGNDEDVVKPAQPAGLAPGSVPDEKLKLRADFYQSNQNVSVTLYVKDAKKEDLDVKYSATQVSRIRVVYPSLFSMLTKHRFRSHPFLVRPPRTFNPVTAKSPQPSHSADKSIPPRAGGPSRRARSNSPSKRPHPASSGDFGAKRISVPTLLALTPSQPKRPQLPAHHLQPLPPNHPQRLPPPQPTQPAAAPAPRTGTSSPPETARAREPTTTTTRTMSTPFSSNCTRVPRRSSSER